MNTDKKSWLWAGAVFLVVIFIIIFVFIFTRNSIEKINENSPCVLNNYSCYDSCPSGYSEVDIGCKMGVCCKKIDRAQYMLYGFVELKEGNCMPPINPDLCKQDKIVTQIAVFPRTRADQIINKYYGPVIGPIKMTISNADDIRGYYKIYLEPGTYSVFAKDSKENNDFYCNSFENDCACCVNLTQDQKFDILIDHSTQ